MDKFLSTMMAVVVVVVAYEHIMLTQITDKTDST